MDFLYPFVKLYIALYLTLGEFRNNFTTLRVVIYREFFPNFVIMSLAGFVSKYNNWNTPYEIEEMWYSGGIDARKGAVA